MEEPDFNLRDPAVIISEASNSNFSILLPQFLKAIIVIHSP